MFWHFSLANVLRATTACNFSPLIWPAGSAPAALTIRNHKPIQKCTTHLKTRCFATFLHFRAPASSLFGLSASLIFSVCYFIPCDFLYVWICSRLCFSMNPCNREVLKPLGKPQKPRFVHSIECFICNSYKYISQRKWDLVMVASKK